MCGGQGLGLWPPQRALLRAYAQSRQSGSGKMLRSREVGLTDVKPE